jgi:hypothetical protein
VTKEISLVSDAGFRNKNNLDVTAHVFINEEFFREFKIQNDADGSKNEQRFSSEAERQQYYERLRQEESERQQQEETERQRKINEINSRLQNASGKSSSGNEEEKSEDRKQNSGISYSLLGRTAKSLPKPNYTGEEEGIVVVKITVDKQGNVTEAKPGWIGTTIMSQDVWEYTKGAALKANFSNNENAITLQEGTIVYRFYKL